MLTVMPPASEIVVLRVRNSVMNEMQDTDMLDVTTALARHGHKVSLRHLTQAGQAIAKVLTDCAFEEGAHLEWRYRHETLPVTGLDCADCLASTLEQRCAMLTLGSSLCHRACPLDSIAARLDPPLGPVSNPGPRVMVACSMTAAP